MTTKERNKQVKQILSVEFGSKNVSVTGGKGTAYGWVNIEIKTDDPCPFKQHENSCSFYCKDRICKGNNLPINDGWGNTVRQLKYVELQDKTETLIKGIDFGKFCSDDGYNTMLDEVNISIVFREEMRT